MTVLSIFAFRCGGKKRSHVTSWTDLIWYCWLKIGGKMSFRGCQLPLRQLHVRRRQRGRLLVKMCFYKFALEFRIYLELSSVSVVTKTCPCWICYEWVQFEIEIRKNSRFVIHVLQTTQNLVISRCFAEDGKEIYQEFVIMHRHSHCFSQ